jgi:PAS domain S-box-containing protein
METRGTFAKETDLLAAVLAALDGEEPQACLDAAIRTLGACGLAQPDGSGEPWLRLERGSRSLVLVAAPGVQAPDPGTRSLLGHALGAALSRTAERDDAHKLGERLSLLQAASFEGILIHDQGVVVDCNERWCEMFGYSRDEMFHPGSMERGVAPEDLAAAQERIQKGIEGEFVITCVRKDGTRLRAEFSTKQTRLGDRPLRVVALRNVTERERTAALLRESEERLRLILEATFDGVIISRSGKVIDASDGIARFFGRGREELIGSQILNLVAPSEREAVSRRIEKETVGSYETVAIAAGGELAPVMVVTVMSTLDGAPARVAALRDLREARRLEHERRQLELQVERSQRLDSLGVLASGIAHDFNNLLVGILGGSELLLGTVDDADQRVLLESIHTAGERAANLTKQMLAYAGRRSLATTEPIVLADLWRELRTLLDAGLSKKAYLEIDVAPDCVVLGERATLMQVFMNLLTNASDALDDKPGTIRVSAERVLQPDARWQNALGVAVGPGNWVLVRVQDSGAGMDTVTASRIFEPFFSTKPRGHGLGLGSCLGIIKAHGGAMLVESSPGQGSAFSVLLPATELRSTPVVGAKAQGPSLSCHLLVIDDQAPVRAHVRRVLEKDGFVVTEAIGGIAGLAAVQQNEPDVVLLDMMMPDLNGVEVLRRLRASGSTVPVVLFSGDLDATTERGLKPGMVQSTLQKPFDRGSLLDAIERARREARY